MKRKTGGGSRTFKSEKGPVEMVLRDLNSHLRSYLDALVAVSADGGRRN